MANNIPQQPIYPGRAFGENMGYSFPVSLRAQQHIAQGLNSGLVGNRLLRNFLAVVDQEVANFTSRELMSGFTSFPPQRVLAERAILESKSVRAGSNYKVLLMGALIYSGRDANLPEEAKFKRKCMLANLLYHFDKKYFVDQFLIPALEGNVEDGYENRRFLINVLNGLDEIDFVNLFMRDIDYSEIRNPCDFANELARVPLGRGFERKELLAEIMQRVLTEDKPDAYADYYDNARAILEKLRYQLASTANEKPPEPSLVVGSRQDQAKALFMTAKTTADARKYAEWFAGSGMSIDEEKSFLCEVIADDGDNSYQARLLRANALFCLVETDEPKTVIDQLASIAKDSSDPVLVNIATFYLVRDCGITGIDRVVHVAKDQIASGERAHVLASVIELMQFNECRAAKDIIKRLTFFKYPDRKTLVHAYGDLREHGAEGTIVRCNEKNVTFTFEEKSFKPIAEVFDQIGIRGMFLLAMYDGHGYTTANVEALIDNLPAECCRNQLAGMLAVESSYRVVDRFLDIAGVSLEGDVSSVRVPPLRKTPLGQFMVDHFRVNDRTVEISPLTGRVRASLPIAEAVRDVLDSEFRLREGFVDYNLYSEVFESLHVDQRPNILKVASDFNISYEDLVQTLMTALKAKQISLDTVVSDTFDKVYLTRLLFSLDRDSLMDNYLIPTLEQSVEQSQGNFQYCIDLLANTRDDEIVNLFENHVNYNLINNEEELIASLEQLPEGKLLPVVEGIKQAQKVMASSFETQDDVMPRIARIINKLESNLVCLTIDADHEEPENEPILVERQKDLYLGTLDQATADMTAENINLTLSTKEAAGFYGDFILDDGYDQELTERRLLAIDHFTEASTDNDLLRDFLCELAERSEDPSVVFKCCDYLINHCKEKGRNRYYDLAKKQIEEGVLSYPLAYLCSAVEFQLKGRNSYLFRRILNTQFSEPAKLVDAFKQVDETQLPGLWLDTKGNYVVGVRTGLSVSLSNLLSNFGVINLIDIASRNNAGVARDNIEAILGAVESDEFSDVLLSILSVDTNRDHLKFLSSQPGVSGSYMQGLAN